MCLYPRLILNRKYLPNKKNKGDIKKMIDEREKYVPIGCGNCIECRQQKANEWRIRLCEELKDNEKAYFVTLTIDDKTFEEICNETKTQACNAIATILVRRFLERWRRKYMKSVKHWFITELGEEHDRLHLHGIIFTDVNLQLELARIWKYGNVYIGEYCTIKTINYCVKYMLKIDNVHKDYKQIVLCSKGIGKAYIEKMKDAYKYAGKQTKETYKLPNGREINMPIYYRNHFWNDTQRTMLWMNKLDRGIRYIRGIPFDVTTEHGLEEHDLVLNFQQQVNKKLGYGDDTKEWKHKEYNITLRKLNAKSKLQKMPKL